MTSLELLAPARNKETGVAAIDCGADAVYIAGPDFGARKAAGNSFEDIKELCEYAHRFGVHVFVTFNTVISDDELESAHAQMLEAQAAGADAFIIRDTRIAGWKDIRIPLHASTQCAIRNEAQARIYEALGCSRIILERELPLETVREICSSVQCEVEFFVHGALCVCYSGECRLSEFIDGRSADRGECVQACRSLYDLSDADGKLLLKNKAVLSLKDYNLKARLGDLADAGVSSFKIEGRLKNVSYVKNVVREYDLALNELVSRYPDRYRRASFGHIEGGFVPDSGKTFNRGYTELFLDGKRGKWSSMDTPRSVGEVIGTVASVTVERPHYMSVRVKPLRHGLVLRNGDGFAFATNEGVTGFRGDLCEGLSIKCKEIPGLRKGMTLYRNINSAFEKILETQACNRFLDVALDVRVSGGFSVEVKACTEDGRRIVRSFDAGNGTAENRQRQSAMLVGQLSKRSGHYNFRVERLSVETPGDSLPLMSASALNSIRRQIAEELDAVPVRANSLGDRSIPAVFPEPQRQCTAELMRSKYCVRYELGLECSAAPLFISNNGRRLKLNFDCAACEMTVTPDS